MTHNKRMIRKYYPIYKKLYIEKFDKEPICWFSFQKWLAEQNIAHTFTMEETAVCATLFRDFDLVDAMIKNGQIRG